MDNNEVNHIITHVKQNNHMMDDVVDHIVRAFRSMEAIHWQPFIGNH